VVAIPRAKETMGPILDVLADGREHVDDDIQEQVAQFFRVTKKERAVLMKNGTPFYRNRTAWGLVYLQDVNRLPDTRPFIEKTDVRNGSEVYKITPTGKRAQRDRALHVQTP
jgi:restriction endonuclease Mrr